MLLSTTETLQGREIGEYLGTVRGISVQTKNLFRDMGAGLKSLGGGKLAGYEQMTDVAYENAEKMLIAQGKALGADAIVGIRVVSPNTTGAGSSEIVIYGTAVKFA